MSDTKSEHVATVELLSGETVEIRRLEGGALVGFDGAYLEQLADEEQPNNPYGEGQVIVPNNENPEQLEIGTICPYSMVYDADAGCRKCELNDSQKDAYRKVLLEFVQDIEVAYPSFERLNQEWPDLLVTYHHAKEALSQPDPLDILTCERCGSGLDNGLCRDETCPFSDHYPYCPVGWAGHPERDPNPNDEEGRCACVHIQVEYDLAYYGGNYSGVGQFVYLSEFLIRQYPGDEEESVHAIFQRITGHNPCHIVSYNVDERYDKDGNLLE